MNFISKEENVKSVVAKKEKNGSDFILKSVEPIGENHRAQKDVDYMLKNIIGKNMKRLEVDLRGIKGWQIR